MLIGMVGLGRMGSSLVRRLTKKGHKCVVYDVNLDAVNKTTNQGIQGVASIGELIEKLSKPRAVWIMVPAGVTEETIDELALHMDPGDIIIDGGNSYYHDDLLRAKKLKLKDIHYVDCGTSGGVFGEERGFCLMIGGEDQIIKHLDPIFKSSHQVSRSRHAPQTGKATPVLQSMDICIVAPPVQGISSRWFTTVLSMASWQLMPRIQYSA